MAARASHVGSPVPLQGGLTMFTSLFGSLLSNILPLLFQLIFEALFGGTTA